MIKKGHNYVASIEIEFETLKQTENFCHEGTMIGQTIKEDLKDDDLEALDALFTAEGDGVGCQVDFEDGFTEDVEKELKAAARCGADFTLTMKWVPNP